MPTLENRRKGKISSQTSRSKNEYIEKEQGTRGGEKVEEENEEAAEGDACGFTKGVSGYQWNTGTILFTILSGVYSREREGCGAEGRTVPRSDRGTPCGHC